MDTIKKTKPKSLLSILLTICMVLTMLPMVAFAEEETPRVTIDGKILETGKYYTVGADGKSINDPEESAPAEGTGYAYLNGNILTLSNFNYTSPSATAICIEYHNCTINKVGESTIASTNDDMVSHTITAVKTLTLTGAGTLNVIAGEAVYESTALVVDNVTVNEGTLNVIGGTATNGSSYGISIFCYCTLKVSGGTVNVIGGTSTYESCGVSSPGGGVIVSDNGILNANGGSCGVTAGQVTVSAGGTLVSL